MEIKQHMNTEVKTCTEDENVVAVAKKMAMYDIGSMVVVKAGMPVGIFTERDMLKRVVAEDRDLTAVTVGEVMTREVVTIEPETSVGVAYHICVTKNVRHIPVVKDGNLVGIISMKNLSKVLDDRFYSTYMGRYNIPDMSGNY